MIKQNSEPESYTSQGHPHEALIMSRPTAQDKTSPTPPKLVSRAKKNSVKAKILAKSSLSNETS